MSLHASSRGVGDVEAGGSSRGVGDVGAGGSSSCARMAVQGCFPPCALASFEDMTECGEEGMLLDALVVTAWPLYQVGALLQPAWLRACGLASAHVRSLATQPPFQHRLAALLPDVPGGGGGGGVLLLDLAFKAVGRTWVRLQLLPGSAARAGLKEEPGQGSGAGVGAERPLLGTIRSQLSVFGTAVVVSEWSEGAVLGGWAARARQGGAGQGVPGPGALRVKGVGPLWVLVENARLLDVMTLMLKCCVMS